MKRLDDLKLPQNVSDALRAAHERLTKEFNIDRILLFGSVVRGTAVEGSDEDLSDRPGRTGRSPDSRSYFQHDP